MEQWDAANPSIDRPILELCYLLGLADPDRYPTKLPRGIVDLIFVVNGTQVRGLDVALELLHDLQQHGERSFPGGG